MTGNNVSKYRKKRGLSQAELCREANIPRGVLSMVETGVYYAPMEQLRGIAQALEVRIDQLYGQEVLRAVYGICSGAEEKPKEKRRTVNVRVSAQLAGELDALAEADGLGSRDATATLMLRFGLHFYRRYCRFRGEEPGEGADTDRDKKEEG